MSLFNRPAWAKSQTATGSDETEGNIFSHSDRSYRDIVAEQERKKQAKLEKKKAKEERRSSGKREIHTDHDEVTAFKKRRISIEDDGVDIDFSPPPLARNASVDGYEYAAGSPSAPSTRRSPRRPHDTAAGVVELRHSDEEVVYQDTKALLPPVEIIDDESDDEFAELARQAREERLQRGDQGKKPQPGDLRRDSRSPRPGALDTGQTSLPTPPPPDPPVQLFITSRLPGTREMIVYRKLSQNLADVRKVWCGKQGMTEEQTRDVFFVHRMRRVYDVTTCKSLGLEVDSFGNLTLQGAEGKDIDKIHLEAVTDDIFKQIKAEKAQELQASKLPADAGTDEDEAGVEQPEESFIRLVLKANKQEDFKLKVKPTTTISKIIDAFTKKRLQEGESAYLAFDGERLDPNNEVQNTDISDMDCIEVHISSA